MAVLLAVFYGPGDCSAAPRGADLSASLLHRSRVCIRTQNPSVGGALVPPTTVVSFYFSFYFLYSFILVITPSVLAAQKGTYKLKVLLIMLMK